MSGGGAREKTGVGRKGSLVRTPDPCLERKCVTDASTGPVRDVCGRWKFHPRALDEKIVEITDLRARRTGGAVSCPRLRFVGELPRRVGAECVLGCRNENFVCEFTWRRSVEHARAASVRGLRDSV